MAEKSTAVTRQPRSASQIALRPSPVPRSSARPGARPASSSATKRFGSAVQTSSVLAYASSHSCWSMAPPLRAGWRPASGAVGLLGAFVLGDAGAYLVHVELARLGDELVERGRGQGARLSVQHDVVADDHQQGDGGNAERGRQLLLCLGVHLAEHRIRVLFRRLLEDGAEHAAGTAPFSPEVHQREVGAADHGLEILGRQLDRCHRCLLSFQRYLLRYPAGYTN